LQEGITQVWGFYGRSLAGLIDAPGTLILGGVICIISVSVYFKKLPSVRPFIRPIFERMGILPEIAAGIEETSEVRICG
jgi:hypothetical protein